MASLLAATPPAVLTDPARSHAARDRTEDALNEVFSRAMRKYLARVEKALRNRVRTGGTVLTAASDWDDPVTLGQLAGWWAEIVNEEVTAAILEAWRVAYASATGDLTESALQTAVAEYLPRVTDRLVRGEVFIGGKRAPSVAEDSFEKARLILAQSAAHGWTRPQTAARIALEFGWETNGPGWRDQLDQLNQEIASVLDPLGEPGTPAREYARLHDQAIAALQEERGQIVQQLDAERSYWENRAQLIARTESTSLHGFAANKALSDEGFTHKKWVATKDSRTREEHREVDGDVVPVDGDFIVGDAAMQYPGDPSAPVGMIANCRCTLVGVDQEPESPAAAASHQDLASAYGSWLDTHATEDQVEAFQRYTRTSAYERWNPYLRGQHGDLSQKDLRQIEYLNDLIQGSDPLRSSITVNRGIKDPDNVFGSALMRGGTEFRDNAFVSTTMDDAIMDYYRGGGGAVVNIRVPAGTRVAVADTEGQVLLGPGTRFRVISDKMTDVIRDPDGYKILLEDKARKGWTDAEFRKQAIRWEVITEERLVELEVIPDA